MHSYLEAAAVVERLGWVLVHSLWEFALIALVAVVLRQALRQSSSATRYVSLLIVFSVLAAAPAATWLACPRPELSETKQIVAAPIEQANLWFQTRNATDETEAGSAARFAAPDSPDSGARPANSWWIVASTSAERMIKPWLNAIVTIWSCGVLAFAFRPLVGWYTLRRLRRVGTAPVPQEVRASLERIARRLTLNRAVQVLQSTLVQVPLVIGYLRPAILLPVSVVANLPALQLDAILAHELAHIQRHDYLVNLIQTLVETAFFFHPAVWWLSRQVRNERENCCDDLAIVLLGSRVEYGRALLSVEELRGTHAVLAIGAGSGSLAARIRRLVVVEPTRRSLYSWSAGAAIWSLALAIVVAATLGVLAAVKSPNDTDVKNQAPDSNGDTASTKRDSVTEPAGEQTRSLDIVIAEHVLLWDGKIVTWEQVVEGLRAIRGQKGAPIHPNFKFTNGAIKIGLWDRYQAAAFEAYKELFEPAGMSIGSISPRAGERYDAIRTADDLIPKPEHIRTGVVRSAAGRPVSVAVVVLMPEDSIMPVILQPNLSLRDTLDEVWVRTDKEGRFKIACPDSGFRLVVLSPAGFALAPVPKSGERVDITLLPNAELELQSTDKSPRELNVTVQLPGMKENNSGFTIYEIKVGEQSKTLRLPPGKVTVGRVVEIDKGTKQQTPEASFDLKPGDKKAFSVGMPVPVDHEQGSDLLRKIRRESEPLLAGLANDHGYALAKGQAVRRVAPPFAPLRMTYYRVRNPDQAQAIPRGPSAITFRWKDDRLTGSGMTFGTGPDAGYTLLGVMDALLQIKSQRIEAPTDLLEKRLTGDWIVRTGAAEDQILSQFESILRDELSLPVHLAFREIDRQVYVAGGTYRHQAIPGRQAQATLILTDETLRTDVVNVFGKQLVPNSGAGGGTGEFPEFLDWLGRWIEVPVVSELRSLPANKLSWMLHERSPSTEQTRAEDHDAGLVLANITAQTGLTFRKEKRPVKILVVERDQ